VVTRSDAPSCRKSVGKLGVWPARSGPGSSVPGRLASGVVVGLDAAGNTAVVMNSSTGAQNDHFRGRDVTRWQIDDGTGSAGLAFGALGFLPPSSTGRRRRRSRAALNAPLRRRTPQPSGKIFQGPEESPRSFRSA